MKQTGDDLYIFNTYGGFEVGAEYNDCEYIIFQLPLKSHLDGVILIANNIDSINRLTGIIQMCRKKKLPTATMKFCTRFLYEHYATWGTYKYVWAWWFPRQMSLQEFLLSENQFGIVKGHMKCSE